MRDKTSFEPAPTQVVSDLGQLLAFNEPIKVRLLRLLQREQATRSQLATAVGESADTITGHILTLLSLGLVRQIEGESDGDENEIVYRATARIYDLQPEPRDNDTVMVPVANATLDAVRHDVVTSLTEWPNQLMNFESRRLRMSQARAAEFNEKLIDLLGEYWGNPDHPVDDDPGEPVMAFAGIWYRSPGTSGT